MPTSTARYETANGSKYLQQLCKHFGHKVEVRFTPDQGSVALQPGPAEMIADETGLTVRVTAEDMKGLISARYVIDSHLVTFAHREGFSGLHWVLEPEAT